MFPKGGRGKGRGEFKEFPEPILSPTLLYPLDICRSNSVVVITGKREITIFQIGRIRYPFETLIISRGNKGVAKLKVPYWRIIKEIKIQLSIFSFRYVYYPGFLQL